MTVADKSLSLAPQLLESNLYNKSLFSILCLQVQTKTSAKVRVGPGADLSLAFRKNFATSQSPTLLGSGSHLQLISSLFPDQSNIDTNMSINPLIHWFRHRSSDNPIPNFHNHDAMVHLSLHWGKGIGDTEMNNSITLKCFRNSEFPKSSARIYASAKNQVIHGVMPLKSR